MNVSLSGAFVSHRFHPAAFAKAADRCAYPDDAVYTTCHHKPRKRLVTEDDTGEVVMEMPILRGKRAARARAECCGTEPAMLAGCSRRRGP